MTNGQANRLLNMAAELVKQALELDPDLKDDSEACHTAEGLRAQLVTLRVCSECSQAAHGPRDVCDGCWDAYCERNRREDAYANGEPLDGGHFCEECGKLLGRNDGPICEQCQQEDRDGVFAYDPDLDEARDRAWEEEAQEEQRELAEERDWEGEALALEEARRDAEVEPWGD